MQSLIVVHVHSEHLPLVLPLARHEVVVRGEVLATWRSGAVAAGPPVKAAVAHGVVTRPSAVLGRGPGQGVAVVLPLVRPMAAAVLLLPARLHVPVSLEGVVVVVGRAMVGWGSVVAALVGGVVLPLGLA